VVKEEELAALILEFQEEIIVSLEAFDDEGKYQTTDVS
jgi:hypothetical protein